jgi:hypothetical protein
LKTFTIFDSVEEPEYQEPTFPDNYTQSLPPQPNFIARNSPASKAKSSSQQHIITSNHLYSNNDGHNGHEEFGGDFLSDEHESGQWH